MYVIGFCQSRRGVFHQRSVAIAASEAKTRAEMIVQPVAKGSCDKAAVPIATATIMISPQPPQAYRGYAPQTHSRFLTSLTCGSCVMSTKMTSLACGLLKLRKSG
jgi:hypothetical protein